MASEERFKAGQIVRLKSGGPEMTVEHEEDDLLDKFEAYRCQWSQGGSWSGGVSGMNPWSLLSQTMNDGQRVDGRMDAVSD